MIENLSNASEPAAEESAFPRERPGTGGGLNWKLHAVCDANGKSAIKLSGCRVSKLEYPQVPKGDVWVSGFGGVPDLGLDGLR